jgi:hypothetical protein
MMILRHQIIIINSAQNTKPQPPTFFKNKKTKSKDKLLKFSTMYQTPSARPAPQKKKDQHNYHKLINPAQSKNPKKNQQNYHKLSDPAKPKIPQGAQQQQQQQQQQNSILLQHEL